MTSFKLPVNSVEARKRQQDAKSFCPLFLPFLDERDIAKIDKSEISTRHHTCSNEIIE